MNPTNNIQVRTSIEFRQSVFLFVFKLFLTVFILEGLLLVINFYFFDLNDFPPNLHVYIHSVLFACNIIKNVIEIILFLKITMNWVSTGYYFSIPDKNLIKKDGLLNIKEKIYDLKNLRSFTVNQSFFGKLFHYGDVVIETSASGGYQEKVFLTSINNPKQCEAVLQECTYSN